MVTNLDKPGITKRRILVLGSANHTRLVKAYEWHNLPPDLNVSDYDTIILNLAPFQDREFAKNTSTNQVPSWQQFARQIFSQGSEIIVIGSPNFGIGSSSYLPSTWWLPIEPAFVYEAGVDIREVQAEFAYYFEIVRGWSFYLEGIRENKSGFSKQYLTIGVPGANSMRTGLMPLAETRFHRPIGFKLVFDAAELGQSRSPARFMKTSGDVFWLPAPTEASVAEGIDLILRQRYGLQFERVPPEWIGNFQLPAQLPIQQAISERETAIAELTRQLEADRQNLAQTSRFLKLLYEQGEDVLEPVARDALRYLGARVEDPRKKGREDGRLVDPFGRQGMLEIKGRSGTLRLSDIRELDNWVRDVIANEKWHSKGLLIVNLQCEEDPRNRKNTVPANCLDAAKTFDIAIVTTGQLFQGLSSNQKHTLDQKAFWDRIFSASGLCDLPDVS